MRDRFPVLLAGGLALFAVLGFFLLGEARRGTFAEGLSTYSSEPGGARALYLLATEAGLPLTRWRAPWEAMPEGTSWVLLGTDFGGTSALPSKAPTVPSAAPKLDGGDAEDAQEEGAVSKDELEAFLARVHEGSRALVLVDRRAQPLLAALSAGLEVPPASTKAPSATPTRLLPALPSPYLRGVTELEAPVEGVLELPPTAVPLLLEATTKQVVGGVFPWGQGEVVVIAAPGLGRNDTLGRADNARFWLTALGALRSSRTGPLAVDENHHGFAEGRSVAAFALRYGLPFAIGQLLLGLFGWALSLRRLGRPLPTSDERRRSSTDALLATARLYRVGKHHARAAELLVRGVTADLGRVAGTKSGSSPGAVLEALRRQGRDEAAAQLEALQREEPRVHTDLQLQALATRAARARQLLHTPKSPHPKAHDRS